MSDQAQGTIADAGQTVQRGINQAADAKDQLTQYILDRPIPAVVIALALGYLLGKIT